MYRDRRTVVLASLLSLIVALGGCGSGGGSSAPTGNAAVRSAAIAGYQSLGAGTGYLLSAIVVAAPAGSPLAFGAAAGRPALLRPRPRLAASSAAVAAAEYSEELGLYSTVGGSGSTVVFSYFRDAALAQPAGTATISVSRGTVGNYPSYPLTVTAVVDVTAGNLPCQGNGTITFLDASGSNTIVGTLTLTRNGEVLKLNLAGTASGATVAVSAGAGAPGIVILENGTEIDGTNVSGDLGGDVTFDVALKPQGYTGHGTLNLFQNTMSVVLTSPAGASAGLDPSGALLIGYADGTNETVQEPITAALTGGGGGSHGGTLAYGAMIPIAAPSGKFPSVVSHSADNRLAGSVGPAYTANTPALLWFSGLWGHAAYWPSPTAAAVLLPEPAGAIHSIATGVNVHGRVVGVLDNGVHRGIAATWQVPAGCSAAGCIAAPVQLSVPPDALWAGATAVNDAGAIVGYGMTATNGVLPLYWASADAPYQLLPGLPAGGQQAPVAIDATGRIAASFTGTESDGLGALWPTPTSSPIALGLAPGHATSTTQWQVLVAGMNASGLVVGSSVSYMVTTGGDLPTTWSPPGYSPAAPIGGPGDIFLTAVNSAGAMAGSTRYLDDYLWLPGQGAVAWTTYVPCSYPTPFCLRGLHQLLDDYSVIGTASPNVGEQGDYYVPATRHP